MEATGILLNCVTFVMHIFSLIISLTILILIIYRAYFNHVYQRRIDIRLSSSSVFDDNVSLLLIGNTYLTFVLLNLGWILLIFRTFIGDFVLLKNIVDLGDSTTCRVQVGIIFFVTSTLYHSFLLQALSRLINITFVSGVNTRKICGISFDNIWLYILMILCSWLISFLVLIPAYTIFNVFSYFSEQYHCMISFGNVKGFIYSLLVCYLIPVGPILYIYSRIISYVRHLPKRGLLMRTRREVTVVRHILKTCFGMSILGFPTLFFLLQFIITGHIHPLADRIHELCVAFGAIAFTFSFAIRNSLIHIVPQLPAAHERNNVINLLEFSS